MEIKGYLHDSKYEDPKLKGIKYYTAGIGMTGIFRSNHVESVEGGFILSTKDKWGNSMPFAVASTAEEADKKAYEHAKNELTSEVRSLYYSAGGRDTVKGFDDQTKRGKLEEKL